MKVVVNKCYGGFELSPKAINRYYELQGIKVYFYIQYKDGYMKVADVNGIDDFSFYFLTDYGDFILNTIDKKIGNYGNIERHDKYLVQTVEELGKYASGNYSKLEVVEMPDDVNYEIQDYDGYESIHEVQYLL